MAIAIRLDAGSTVVRYVTMGRMEVLYPGRSHSQMRLHRRAAPAKAGLLPNGRFETRK